DGTVDEELGDIHGEGRLGGVSGRCIDRAGAADIGQLRPFVGLHDVWSHGIAGTHALQSIHDDAFARLQAGFNDAHAVLDGTQLHFAVGGLVIFVHHQYETLVLVGADGGFIDEYGLRS